MTLRWDELLNLIGNSMHFVKKTCWQEHRVNWCEIHGHYCYCVQISVVSSVRQLQHCSMVKWTAVANYCYTDAASVQSI